MKQEMDWKLDGKGGWEITIGVTKIRVLEDKRLKKNFRIVIGEYDYSRDTDTFFEEPELAKRTALALLIRLQAETILICEKVRVHQARRRRDARR
jgi:hypothetical protein